ncbi:MAG TPA: lytic transglycosylase domain-containing protein [Longimicrobiales bacterium]
MDGRHHRPRGRRPRPPVFPYDPYVDAAGDVYGHRPRRGRARAPAGHGWRRAYDAPPPERRRSERRQWGRRRSDREGWRDRWERLKERERERGWTGRAREMLRRYREPLIGLTMAGAAAPIAKAARAPVQPPEGVERRARAAAARPGGIEEAVGEEWAASEAEQIREDTVTGAQVRYGISRSLAEDIYDAAIESDIDPDVAFGLVNTESTFDTRAVSHVGARGLTQVMPRTAAWLRPGTTAEDLFDRNLNLRLGFGYLRDLIDRYDGNVRLALLAYNRGPGTVDRVLRQGGDPDNGYADKVLSG